MKNNLLKVVLALVILANVSIIAYAKAKTYVITPSAPVVSESMKPIIKDYREGNYTQSMIKLEELVTREPFNTYAQYYLALTYTRLGKKDEAKKCYKNVIDMNTTMSLRYYSQKALACLDNPTSKECSSVSSTNRIVRDEKAQAQAHIKTDSKKTVFTCCQCA